MAAQEQCTLAVAVIHLLYMLIIGHRGARGLAPENTRLSLAKSLEYGVDMIEIDARVTKDGIAVAHHDSRLTDPTGVSLRISDYTLAELRQHKADLLRLDDALAFVHGRLPIILEVKPHEPLTPIVHDLRHAAANGWAMQDLFVASFDYAILREARRLLPETPLIVNEPWSGIRASFRAHRLRTKYMAMNAKWLWSGFIKVMSRSGYRLFAYTINDPGRARQWKRAGLSGIFTDYPDRFKA